MTRASKVLPGTGGREPSELSWSSGMPSSSRSPGACWTLEPANVAGGPATVKRRGVLTPSKPLTPACVACAVYWPGASDAAGTDHVSPERVATSVCTGVPAATGPG